MRNRANRTADRRRSFTGENHQVAYSGLRLGGQPPIPPASTCEQQNFEADVFGAILTSHNRFTEYPFGIRSVHPPPNQPGSRGREREARQEPADRAPAGLRGGHRRGSPARRGLRIRQITERGLELHIDGRRTSLWLTGMPPRSAWHRIVKDRAAEDFPRLASAVDRDKGMDGRGTRPRRPMEHRPVEQGLLRRGQGAPARSCAASPSFAASLPSTRSRPGKAWALIPSDGAWRSISAPPGHPPVPGPARRSADRPGVRAARRT
ncbi:hypothetical protein GTV15_20635 [Streptomyces sp. SID7803]|nr:hypothetical protein [Streptomyces sp. SID7803]